MFGLQCPPTNLVWGNTVLQTKVIPCTVVIRKNAPRSSLASFYEIIRDGKWYKCLTEGCWPWYYMVSVFLTPTQTGKRHTHTKQFSSSGDNQRETANRNWSLTNTLNCRKYWRDSFLQWPEQRKTTCCTEGRQNMRLCFFWSSEKLWENWIRSHKLIRTKFEYKIYSNFFLSGDQVIYYFQQ